MVRDSISLDIVFIKQLNQGEKMSTELAVQSSVIPSNAVEVLPDSDRFKCRFKVRSESSNQLYLISFDASAGWWTCSCRGNIRHGSCKHLEAAGLKGRKYGKANLLSSPAPTYLK
jgi:hypothetical protein